MLLNIHIYVYIYIHICIYIYTYIYIYIYNLENTKITIPPRKSATEDEKADRHALVLILVSRWRAG
jgi:hypothetical protein